MLYFLICMVALLQYVSISAGDVIKLFSANAEIIAMENPFALQIIVVLCTMAIAQFRP